MAVPEQTPFIEYTANGTTTVFPVPFQCDKAEYLIVKVNDLIQLLGTWSFIDGSVVFNTAPLIESIVTIQRSTKLSRTTDYSLYDNSFRPEPVNYDFDNIWRVLQEVAYQFTIAENKFQDLIDQLVEGNINGLPAEILARIAGDQANNQLISQEIARAYFAEKVLEIAIKAEEERAKSSEDSLQLQITTSNAGIKYFSTEAELLAFVPTTTDPKQAYAFDTKKNYLWVLKSGSTTEYEWKDEGKSQLTLAEEFTSEKVEFQYAEKLFKWVDLNKIPVMYLDALARLWLAGLPKDVATHINEFIEMQKSIYFKDGKHINALYDLNGLPIAWISSNGDTVLPKIGVLTEYIQNKINSVNRQYVDSINQSAFLTDSLAVQTMGEFQQQQTVITAADVNAAAVFPHNVTKLRIPAITRIQKNKYLCFFEARLNDDDFGENSQGVCTLTVNESTFEITTSDIKALHAREVRPSGGFYTFMNACATKLDSGRVICLYVKRYGTSEHYIYKRYSDDDGLTWSDYENIGTQLNMTFYNLLCPCSQGLVKRYGSNKGRIIFPVWYSGKAYVASDFRAGYIYSDDGGTTWHDGAFAEIPYGNEVQCAEDLNGDLIFAIRLDQSAGGGTNDPTIQVKKLVKLLNGTLSTFRDIPTPRLTNARVMSGLIQSKNAYDRSTPKLQFICANDLNRKNLKVWNSYDSGLNWTQYDVPNTEVFAAYSCIEKLSYEKNLLLWEADNYSSLKTSIVSLRNLIGVA
ncbi:sialidase family protein [Acinetobacter baumannii]|nr:sialidase family protein [Acinetobacter baumannii]MDX7905361.1 sialidase family protein [Acinetobacter baumannii]MDX7925106.1 sialidase family protein [Acinetobacter baumannii]